MSARTGLAPGQSEVGNDGHRNSIGRGGLPRPLEASLPAAKREM